MAQHHYTIMNSYCNLSSLCLLLVLSSLSWLPNVQAQPEQGPAQRPSKCPAGCSAFGTCNEELARCDCLKNMTGTDCGTPTPPVQLETLCTQLLYPDVGDCLSTKHHCLNNCNNRGTCVSGFCLCQPGHYGADCSLSLGADGTPQLLANSSWTLRKKRPWIYVYELPPQLTSWVNVRRLDRPTHNVFWQRLLSSGARVADPEKADWFYIPIRQRGMGDSAWLEQAIQYISATWPYWQRYQGHRHFLFQTGDLGVDEADDASVQLAKNVTWLTHWGLYKDHPYANWKAAHRPGKDIVVPVLVSAGHFKHIGMDKSPLHPMFNDTTRPRDQYFFFAGRICGHRGAPNNSVPWPRNCGVERDGYSGGVRQAVHYYHSNRTGWKVALHDRKYSRALATTKYCLAPLGGGHGQRQVLAAFMGCVPVTIGDNVYQPFEPEVPWPEFSVPVLENQVPDLHNILEDITPEQLEHKQKALRCAAQHMVWSSIMGGFVQDTGRYDAFETILEILRVKLLYPDAKPEDYVKLDSEFRQFIACGAEELGQDPPPSPLPPALCSHSWYDGKNNSCYDCIVGSSPSFGVPGGVICCKHKRNLGSCPRTWE